MTLAIVFPGQGSQSVGMMQGFADIPVVEERAGKISMVEERAGKISMVEERAGKISIIEQTFREASELVRGSPRSEEHTSETPVT